MSGPVPTAAPRPVLVLLGLRLGSVVPAGVLAGRLGVAPGLVASELAGLADAGLVEERTGRLAGWMLTSAGRAEGERLLAEELASRGSAEQVRQAYHDFLALNPELLALCTAWQLRDVDGAPVVNDHHDDGYDRAVLDRLAALDHRARPVCTALGDALDRFEGYEARLVRARVRVEAGEADYLDRPTVDSYHTIWFELHENLLATLGIDRAAEREALDAGRLPLSSPRAGAAGAPTRTGGA